jgi:NAD(P)-dependent dehydrogenase (short-subunit alcohol dehydrogenase family)
MAGRGWITDDIDDLHDRIVLVTGANSGLGLASATALASKGATVLMACRDPQRGRAASERVAAVATGEEPRLVELDLADLESVRRAADHVSSTVPRLDVLMNNAGVMAPPLLRTAQGHELQFGTNHLGHFALTGRLQPLLAAAPTPRVVTTSSTMHRVGKLRWDDPDWHRGYRKWPAYGQSKLANLMFAFELDRRSRAAGTALQSMAAHPGYASTHLQAAGPELSGNRLMGGAMGLLNGVVAQSAEMGALPQLYAATSELAVGGAYYGPDGPGEMRGHPRRVGSTSASLDTDQWRRLWTLSEELTGVDAWPG